MQKGDKKNDRQIFDNSYAYASGCMTYYCVSSKHMVVCRVAQETEGCALCLDYFRYHFVVHVVVSYYPDWSTSGTKQLCDL